MTFKNVDNFLPSVIGHVARRMRNDRSRWW